MGCGLIFAFSYAANTPQHKAYCVGVFRVSFVAPRLASLMFLCINYHQQNSLIDLRSLISVGYFLHWSKTVLIWADQMEKGAISSFAVVALVMFKAPSFQILSYLGPPHPHLGGMWLDLCIFVCCKHTPTQSLLRWGV